MRGGLSVRPLLVFLQGTCHFSRAVPGVVPLALYPLANPSHRYEQYELERHAGPQLHASQPLTSCTPSHVVNPCRYEQYELERAQLRDMQGRSKAEVEAMALAHAEEVEALSARAAETEARLGAKLEAAEGELSETWARLEAAEVRRWLF